MRPTIRVFIVYLGLFSFVHFGLLRTYFGLEFGAWMIGLLVVNALFIQTFCVMGESSIEDFVKSGLIAIIGLLLGSQIVDRGWLHFNIGYALMLTAFYATVSNGAVKVAADRMRRERQEQGPS